MTDIYSLLDELDSITLKVQPQNKSKNEDLENALAGLDEVAGKQTSEATKRKQLDDDEEKRRQKVIADDEKKRQREIDERREKEEKKRKERELQIQIDIQKRKESEQEEREKQRKLNEAKEKQRKEFEKQREEMKNTMDEENAVLDPETEKMFAELEQMTRKNKEINKEKTEICCVCKTIIDGKLKRVDDKNYHPKCLTCHKCKKPIDDFYRVDGHLVCSDCVFSALPTCCKCGLVIQGEFLDALEKKWHPDCFRCTQCLKELPAQFSVYAKMPFCSPECAAMKNRNVCDFCGKALVGAFVRFENKKLHNSKECFHCTLCKTGFPDLKYFIVKNEPYCNACATLSSIQNSSTD